MRSFTPVPSVAIVGMIGCVQSTVASALIEDTNIDPSAIDLIVGGMVLQDMTESNPARIVGKRVGIPDSVPAFTVNMQCCSGMATLIQSAYQVASGGADVAMAVGMESMSNAPHMVPGSRWGHRLGSTTFLDTLKECTLAGSRMWGESQYMIDVAENHAKVDDFNREQMDAYAIVSHDRAIAAAEAGRFDEEIVPIEVPGRRGPTIFERDENPRASTMESLGALPTVQTDGVITAGNAASINDGAAAAIIASAEAINRHNLTPIARIPIEGMAMVGCDPNLMGYSCVDALNSSLAKADKKVSDLDLIECNEGFAVQLIACEEMGGWDRDRLNVDGGSLGLGHPVGMSGLRIVLHLAKALHQRDLKFGAATVPAGSGLGASVLVEAV